MEYQELKREDELELARSELRSFETQHAGFVNDEAKYGELLGALDAGQFREWDNRIRQQRAEDWRIQRNNARANRESTELLITFARRRVERLSAPKGSDDRASDIG